MGDVMRVHILIKFLQTQDPNLHIAYSLHSEQCLMQERDIVINECCEPRGDGWVQNQRPDMPSIKYLMFPGN